MHRHVRICLLVYFVLGFAALTSAQVGGSLSGTVRDESGAVIPGATVTATNTGIGTTFTSVTDPQGLYSFPKLPVGRYDVTIQLEGFKPQKRTGLTVDADASLQLNVTLAVGDQSETITVTANATHVEMASTQPGVAPITTIQSNSVIMAGVTGTVAPSGELNAGNVSVSGQRETANGFLVNGGDVQEHMNGGTSIVPNLDSIEEFRVLTNNFDPQYGNYNGGIVNVITKSGSDRLHGNLFEFFRNTALDERNYFSPEKATFKQHQPGGTIGGPLKKVTVFVFADYQVTRTTQGIETGLISVPSNSERAGNFGAAADTLNGSVNGQYWANLLAARLGYAVRPGEPYYVPGCASSSQCVFPNATIPTSAWSLPAQRLLQYIPSPNSG